MFQSGCLLHQVFFNYVVDNNWSIKHIPFQKKHKTLPVVLNAEEIKSLLSVIQNTKYYAIAATLYGAGHRSLKTTAVYTHLTKDFLKEMQSPPDKLEKGV